MTFFKKLSKIKYRFLVDLFSIILNPKYPVKSFLYIKNSPRIYYTLADPLVIYDDKIKMEIFFYSSCNDCDYHRTANHQYLLSKGEQKFLHQNKYRNLF